MATQCSRSRGNVLVRSISSARGAIRSWAKFCTLSRSMSTSCPRPKSNPVQAFGIMARLLIGGVIARRGVGKFACRSADLVATGCNAEISRVAHPTQRRLPQAEPQGGDAEEGEEPDHVRDGGDEWAGRHRRIDAEAVQDQRNEDAAERRCRQHR